MSNLTIVVNTCDSYDDVLEMFFAAFKEYWPDCPYPIVINAERKTYSQYSAITNNYFSEDNIDRWGARLLSTLNTIETEFVLMLYDDFILEGRVNNNDILKSLSYLKDEKNASVFYLVDIDLPSEIYNKDLKVLLPKIDFCLNSSPAIWRRKDIISYTGKVDSPWAWEVFGSYRTYGENKLFYSSCSDIYKYNYEKGGAIYRGKWVEDVVVEKDKKYNLGIDFSIRGFSIKGGYEKRSLKWKLNFLLLGYRMVGFKSLLFVYRYIKGKLS